MATNFGGPAQVLTLLTPSGGVISGTPIQIGSLVVVPVETDAATGDSFAGIVRGYFTAVIKKTTDVMTQGAKLYWDNTNFYLTTTSTSNEFVGYCVDAAGNGATTVGVYLHGAPV